MTDLKTIPGGVVHDLPGDLERALKLDSEALATWLDITPLARNEWICWMQSAKKEETGASGSSGVAKTSGTVSAGLAAGPAARTAEIPAI